VFGARVYQLEVANSAALGAALRAAHADVSVDGRRESWSEIVRGFAEPVASSLITPDVERHAVYEEWKHVYAACEAHALGRGSDPEETISRWRRRTAGRS